MEELEKDHVIEKEKPPFLYHGSPNREIEELEPRQKYVRDPDEGPRIFATQELSLATTFLLEGITASGAFESVPYAIVVGNREEVIKNDKGGHVYVLPSDKFISDPNKGLGRYEWTSEENVKPVKAIEYKSAIDAMLESGVQVYFIDEKTYRKIQESEDHGYSILSGLESENQRRGINAKFLGKTD